jgi:hypothetical protein
VELEYGQRSDEHPRLVVEQHPTGCRILLATPLAGGRLWGDVVATTFASVVLLLFVFLVCGLVLINAFERPAITVTAASLLAAWVLRMIWRLWRTAGPVTALEVEGQWLVAFRRLLHGGLTDRCRVSRVKRAEVLDVGRGRSLLLVTRRRAAAFSAFDGCDRRDLETAARSLNDAVAAAHEREGGA